MVCCANPYHQYPKSKIFWRSQRLEARVIQDQQNVKCFFLFKKKNYNYLIES